MINSKAHSACGNLQDAMDAMSVSLLVTIEINGEQFVLGECFNYWDLLGVGSIVSETIETLLLLEETKRY